MSMNDPLAAVLSSINTYDNLGRKALTTKANSKVIMKVLTLLKENGYLGSVNEIKDGKGNMLEINLLGNINKTGAIKPRFQVKLKDFNKYEKRYLPARNFGLIIISTTKGIITMDEAKKKNMGGRLLAYCY